LLAGTAGTAATLLALLGSGATAGAMLVEYSGLETGTAAQHLLVDVDQTEQVEGVGGGVRFVPSARTQPVHATGFIVEERRSANPEPTGTEPILADPGAGQSENGDSLVQIGTSLSEFAPDLSPEGAAGSEYEALDGITQQGPDKSFTDALNALETAILAHSQPVAIDGFDSDDEALALILAIAETL
jgi:hypothetical protein